jgi:uncharacterized iron-regulated protein
MTETKISGLDRAKILRDNVNHIRAEEARRSTAVNVAYVEMLEVTAAYESALAEVEALDVDAKIRRLAFDALSDGVRPSWVVQVTGLSRSTVYRIKNEIEETW